MEEGSAICPECMSRKSYLAAVCPSCTREIGYGRQFLAMAVYYGTIILTMTFLVVRLKACSG